MPVILVISFFLLVQPALALNCDADPINLNEGDVISADLLQDIVRQVRGVSSGMTNDELNGVWTCTSFNRNQGTLNNYTNNSDGIGSILTQDITFQLQDNGTFVVTYDDNLGQNSISSASGNICNGKLIDGALFVTMSNGTDNCFNEGLYGMRRISKSCFIWEVTNSFPLSSATSCIAKNKVPLAPTNLTYSRTSDGPYTLSWTAASGTVSSYSIKYKDDLEDDFAELTTDTSTSYTVSAGFGEKRWYRVFAVNDNGTSIGSNVILVDDDDSSSD